MISAQKQGISEEELIARMHKAHLDDFTAFGIAFDNYGSTNSEETRQVCHEIWAALRKAGLVLEKEVTQLYDPVAGTFLADRFVKGTCPNPKCNAPDQYGDNCERCGHTYSAAELIDPKSTLSGAKPELRDAKHLFVNTERLHGFLDAWTQTGGRLQPETANYLKGHYLSEPLHDWDVSRPAPYFGFEIPDSPGNYWYVWFDAPIGYIGSTWEWCKRHGESLDGWWRSDQTEIHHFIGYDITRFHTLFWPAMLHSAGFNLPTRIHIHGFLTVDGTKMSKRRGTFIRAATYRAHLDPAYLRYYYASKLTAGVENLDLNLDEFAAKVNADLVGNVVNLASRTAKFAERSGLAAEYPDDGGLFAQAATDGDLIAEAYESGDYHRAMRLIQAAGDRANQFIDRVAPWNIAKAPDKAQDLQKACTIGLNLFRQLAVYLAPVLPGLVRQTGELLNQPIERWEESKTPLLGTPVSHFEHMMVRVRREQVEAMIEDSKEKEIAVEESPKPAAQESDAPLAAEPLVAEQITIDEFTKVDLRIARIVAAEDVPEAKKLLKLTLSLGGEVRRTVFAGIKAAYKPEELLNRLVVCVVNLAPRQMKFGLSEGMVLASGPGGSEIHLLSPDCGAKPGERIH
jgi:methionyl-tRNA synthetase